ncbi:MAG: hypothetical protein LBC19_02350, partial [Tannerella sp.]|nr:hypothetical protein [Tannerella sp.]
ISNHTLEAVRRTGHDAAGIKPDFTQRQAWHHLTASVTLLKSKRDVVQWQTWRYLTASVTLLNGRRGIT